MPTATSTIAELANREYKHGFVTEIETDTVPRGLNEDVVRMISEKKKEISLAEGEKKGVLVEIASKLRVRHNHSPLCLQRVACRGVSGSTARLEGGPQPDQHEV